MISICSPPELGFNEEPGQNTRNRALRCAIKYAVNLEEQNEKFFAGLASIFNGVILPSMAEFEEAPPGSTTAYKPELSRQLLQQSGWTAENLPILDFGTTSSIESRQTFELFKTAQLLLPSARRTDLYRQMNDLLKNDCVTISGISRSRLHAWHRDVIAYPDQDIVGGFALRFYQVKP